MSRRSVGQLSLADQLVKRLAGQNEGLVRMAAMIQWRPLERALAAVYNANEGRPSYPPLVMFKCVLLQQGSLRNFVCEQLVVNGCCITQQSLLATA